MERSASPKKSSCGGNNKTHLQTIMKYVRGTFTEENGNYRGYKHQTALTF